MTLRSMILIRFYNWIPLSTINFWDFISFFNLIFSKLISLFLSFNSSIASSNKRLASFGCPSVISSICFFKLSILDLILSYSTFDSCNSIINIELKRNKLNGVRKEGDELILLILLIIDDLFPIELNILKYSDLYPFSRTPSNCNNNKKKAGKWVPFCGTLGGGVDLGLGYLYKHFYKLYLQNNLQIFIILTNFCQNLNFKC
ncbi:hypothetical protein AGLY_002795 [Aphis glycines]|uniref:Uncharacterized protein n=1 Tax=Aphis glycines TaxID=307491 RepID=A0A6G0U1D8_APHGL|nr:hypothetical protein AGLY_002795 [Aphis glycines]